MFIQSNPIVVHVWICVGEACVLLAALACVEFYPDHQLPCRIDRTLIAVDVPGDGRCLFYTLFLALGASKGQLLGWYNRKRNHAGICMDAADNDRDKSLLVEWFSSLTNVPQETVDRFNGFILSEPEDIAFCTDLQCACVN